MIKLTDYLTIGDAAGRLAPPTDTVGHRDRAGKLTARRDPVSEYRLHLRAEFDVLLSWVDEIENAKSLPRRAKTVKRKAKRRGGDS